MKRASGNEAGLIHPAAWNAMLDEIDALRKDLRRCQPRNSPTVKFKTTPDGFTAWAASTPSGGTGAAATICPFGEIIAIDDETEFSKGIRGGMIVCGDKNFNVPYLGLNTDPEHNTSKLVQIILSGVACATDDDAEIFLPGVTTTTGTPEWDTSISYDPEATPPASYTDTTNPASPASPTGTIVIPIGILTIVSGVPRLAPVSCGNIAISQCAGILSHTRT